MTTKSSLWEIRFNKKAEKEFDKLDRSIQKKLKTYIFSRLISAPKPRQYGHALKGDLRDLWSFRVGTYRLICYIDDSKQTIRVLHIGHRKDIYEMSFIPSLHDS